MNFEKGQLYVIEFLDHCASSETSKAIECRAVGWASEEDDFTISLAWWLTEAPFESERELVNIVKSTIYHYYRL